MLFYVQIADGGISFGVVAFSNYGCVKLSYNTGDLLYITSVTFKYISRFVQLFPDAEMR